MLIRSPHDIRQRGILYHSHAFIGGSTPQVQTRNLTQELQQTLAGYQNTAPGYLALNQQYQPAYGQLNLQNLQQQQQGYTDASGVVHPGTTQLGQDINTSNRGAAVTDLGTFGGDTTLGLLGSNPYLADALNLQNNAAFNAATPSDLLGSLNTGALNPGQSALLGGLNAAAANPSQSALLGALNSRANGTGASGVLGALNQQAQQQLAAGGALSPQEQRDLGQQTLSGFASRGINNGNSSFAADLLSRDSAQRARLQQAQQLASSVEGLNQSQAQLQNQFGLGVQGANLAGLANQQQFGLGVQGANLADLSNQQGYGLNVQNANVAQQGLAGQLAGNAANTASGALTNPLLQLLGLGNLNPGYSGSGTGSSTDSITAANNLFNPTNPYAADVYNSNFNAQNAANIAGANNSAATTGAVLGLVGSLFSDERLKTNVRKTGRKTKQGAPIKSFRYKTDPAKRTFVGVMAQDVEKLNPYAVKTDPVSGLKAVDYTAAEAPFYEMKNPYRKAA